jgi:L-iditol 2-dehydrogenase
MWAYMLSGPCILGAVEVTAPDPDNLAKGQVLLATRAGGICGSDMPRFRGAPFTHPKNRGGMVTRAPGFPMHEIVGEVIASAHPAHDIGDLVVGWASDFDGIAELVVSDGDGLSSYDTRLPPTVAVMLQPLACVLYAAERIGDVRGQTVAMVGQGSTGLLFSHVLKSRGAAHVTGVDPVDRSEASRVFVVDEVVTATAASWSLSLTHSERPSFVVEAVGHQVSTMKNCLDAVAFGGQVFYFGVPDDLIYPFDMMTFLRKNLTLRSGTTMERRRVLQAANDYLGEHPKLREAYVTDVFSVDDVQAAFMAAIQPKTGQYKIAVDMA